LLGDGQARGIALVFLIAGLVMVLAAIAAFFTKSYRTLSEQFQGNTESVKPGEDEPEDATTASLRK
jgi:DHA3 family multidrug efflux protein-like MFS transporter